jgi:hypothetical protein
MTAPLPPFRPATADCIIFNLALTRDQHIIWLYVPALNFGLWLMGINLKNEGDQSGHDYVSMISG